MANESDARGAGYSLLRFGNKEYRDIIKYQPITENAKNVPETFRFVASPIKGCYISWSRSLPSGELRIGDTIYLSVPNGWDGRLQYYPWYTGHIYWQYNQWSYPVQNYGNNGATSKGARGNIGRYDYYHGNETNTHIYRNINRFNDKLLIWYKRYEPRPYSSRELSPVLEDPEVPTDKRTVVRMKVWIQDANTVASFGVKFVTDGSVTYIYSFGDGYTGTYTQESTSITHTYSLPGYYIVDVHLASYSVDAIPKLTLNDISPADVIVHTNFNTANVLRSLYVNSEFTTYTPNAVFLGNNTMLEYVYLSLPCEHLDIRTRYDLSIDNLYIFNTSDSQCAHVNIRCLFGTCTINNIHLSSTIHGLGFFNYAYSNSISVYAYSLYPIKFVDYELYDPIIDVYDFSAVSSKLVVYVRNSVLADVQNLNYNLPVYQF